MKKNTFDEMVERIAAATAKLRQAQKLWDEARRELVLAVVGEDVNDAPKPAKKPAKKPTKKPPTPVDFAVDSPPRLAALDQRILTSIKDKGPLSTAVVMALHKIESPVAHKALQRLLARELITATGNTVNRKWKVQSK
jgi:hypothetical protein